MTKYDNLKFGCEFEFIVNDKQHDQIIKKLIELDIADVAVFKTDKPTEDLSYEKIHYKHDYSLNDIDGREISTPICSYEELKKYITLIGKIIEKYARTTELTGFHIHISIKNDCPNKLNFLRFSLHSNNMNLLNNWGERNKYCMNVMDVFSHLEADDAKNFKEEMGHIWNLDKRGDNWIEIRTFGGTNYHKYTMRILTELDWYITIFNIATDKKTDLCKVLINNHISHVESMSDEEKECHFEVFPPENYY